MGRKINVRGRNIQCQSTGEKRIRNIKPPRDKKIVQRKTTATIFGDYRYHRSGKYKTTNGETIS